MNFLSSSPPANFLCQRSRLQDEANSRRCCCCSPSARVQPQVTSSTHDLRDVFSRRLATARLNREGGRIRSAVDPLSKDESHRIDGREPLVSAAGFIYLHSTNRLQRNSDHCRELYFVCTWRVNLRPVMSWQAKTRGKLPCNIRSCSDWSAKNIRCVWAWTKWGTITRLLA